jgi:hypothetical protein
LLAKAEIQKDTFISFATNNAKEGAALDQKEVIAGGWLR